MALVTPSPPMVPSPLPSFRGAKKRDADLKGTPPTPCNPGSVETEQAKQKEEPQKREFRLLAPTVYPPQICLAGLMDKLNLTCQKHSYRLLIA